MDIEFGFLPQTFFLVLARLLAILSTVPFFGGERMPVRLRIMVGFVIALVITPMVPLAWAQSAGQMTSLPALVLGVMGEVILGAAVGFVCHLFVSIFVVAGDMIAQCAGLSMATEVDPTSGMNNTIITNLLQSLFILTVVLSNGHLVLLKMVAASFYSVPPQCVWITKEWVYGIVSLGSGMFEWGIRLAAPIMAADLILNVGFALVARIAPDFDILFTAIPIRLLVALSLLGVILKLSGYFFDSVTRDMLAACAAMLRVAL